MECLFFLSFSSSILLACYDGTCYHDETLHCNMYGWNNVYVQLAMYEWMELYMYARWNLCAGYVICLLLNSPVKYIYIYICHIFAVKIAGFKKNRKKRHLCRQPLMAKAPLPSDADSKEATRRQPVLPGSWPIWSVCLQRRTAKALPTVADGKGLSRSDVQLTSFGGRQRPDALCHQRRRAKAALSRLTD